MKFYSGFQGGAMKNWLSFGKHHNTLTWPDWGAGHDLEPLGLALHHQGSTFIVFGRVGLSVCLLVSNITQKVCSELQ